MAIGDEKKDRLKKEGCLNRNASKVKADVFNDDNDFFDKNDVVQTRYEMLRSVLKDKRTVNAASGMYGVSRITFYKLKKAYDAQGIQGLLPGKKGPGKPHKLTPDVIRFLENEIRADPSTKADKLAEKMSEKFGYSVHPRTIEKTVFTGKKKRSEKRSD